MSIWHRKGAKDAKEYRGYIENLEICSGRNWVRTDIAPDIIPSNGFPLRPLRLCGEMVLKG